MDTDDDFVLSQLADNIEKEYFSMNQALNDSTDDILLTQAVDFLDMTVSQAVNVYEIDVSKEASFDLGFSAEQLFDIKENVQYPEHVPEANVNNSIKSEPASARFASPITDFDIQQLKSSKVNKNTAKSTRWGFSVLEAWKSARPGSIPDLLLMDKPTMSYWLTRFVMEVRNAKGEEYSPKTLYMIICALLRHLRDNGIHNRNFLDSKDPDYAEFCSVLDLRMKDLLQKGYGTAVKQADPISVEDEDKLWNLSVFGAKDSQTLQHTIFYYSCKLFGLRGRDEHRELKCSQFEIGEDNTGKYVRYIGRSNKTYKGGLRQMALTNKDIKHYCMEGPRCIANMFKLYLDALGNEGDFYRRPLPSAPGDLLRYSSQPIGVNKLGLFMKEIAEKGGLKGNYTNHSGKRTCATQLYNAAVQEQEIMARTGHLSEFAVRQYKRTSEHIQKAVSSVLDPNKENESCVSKMPKLDKSGHPSETLSLLSDITNKAGVVNFSGCTFNF